LDLLSNEMNVISVIIPCYQVARFVREAVSSVLRQNGVKATTIVVDDGSFDDVPGAIEDLIDQVHIFYHRKQNGGVASARNHGFRLIPSGTEFVYFLDGDDYLKPTALAEMSGYLAANPEVGMVHCVPEQVNEHGAVLPIGLDVIRWAFGPRELKDHIQVTPFESIYCLTWIIPSATMIRASVLRQVGGYDESFGQCCEDTDLYLRIALKTPVHFIPEKLVCYRVRAGQSSMDMDRLDRQSKKLYNKWLSDRSLKEDERILVRRSEYFRVNTLPVAQAFWFAKRLWCSGKYLRAARFWQGAVRRWGLRQLWPQRIGL
jgi:glycosyltransferase involved in cell wall biosynthesis